MRSRFLTVGMVAAGVWANCAGAQDVDVTALQMKACTLVKDEAARLRCYDRAMSRPQSEAPLVAIPQSGSDVPLVAIPQSTQTAVPQSSQTSNLERRPETAVETQPTIAAKPEAPSLFGLDSIIQAVRPSSTAKEHAWRVSADKAQLQDASRLLATLASEDGKTTLVLQCKENVTAAYISTDRFLGWESMRVLYRVNDSAAAESRWVASRDGRGAVAPANNAVEFINSLVDGGLLLLRVTDYNGTDHDLRFNLGTASAIRTQIALVCRWPGAAPAEQAATARTIPNSRTPEAKARASVAKQPGTPLQLH